MTQSREERVRHDDGTNPIGIPYRRMQRYHTTEAVSDQERWAEAKLLVEMSEVIRHVGGRVVGRRAIAHAMAAQVVERDAKVLGQRLDDAGEHPDREVACDGMDQDHVRTGAGLLKEEARPVDV